MEIDTPYLDATVPIVYFKLIVLIFLVAKQLN